MLCFMSNQVRDETPWGALLSTSLTVMVSFGVILYGFSVFVTEAAAGADFSKTVLSAAYGGSIIAGGLLAIPIGSHADRMGVRAILALGGVLGAVGMTAFGMANSSWHVLLAWWILIGPAGAMLLYEVAFVAVDQWCTATQRPKALGVLTLIGGLAGIIFIPATEWLVDWLGWRETAFVLAGLVLITASGTSGLALRHTRPPQREPGSPKTVRGLQTRLLRDRRFVVHTAAMTLTFFAAQGLIAHRVALFDESGFDLGVVALWAAAASALSLPGRWVAPLLAIRFKAANVQAVATLFLAAGTVLMLDGTQTWQMVGHFVLFGIAFGAVLPLRAMTMATWYSGNRYGTTMGSQWTVTTVIGAAGPVVVGLLRDTTADYRLSVAVLLAALLGGAALLKVAARSPSTKSID
jgi:MFS family permease